jgi:hypothetical protein
VRAFDTNASEVEAHTSGQSNLQTPTQAGDH